jgi:hypothetical protein
MAAVARRSSTWACPSSGERADAQDENRNADVGDGTATRSSDPTTGAPHAEDTAPGRSGGSGAERAAVKPFRLTPPEPTESQLHATVAQYLDWALLPPAVYTTFPAGWGVLTRSTAGRLKGAGLKQGMPDILVFFNGFTLGIELKSWRGKLTAVQEAMHAKLKAAGVRIAVCTSLMEVIDFLRIRGVPLRRTKGASDDEREPA